MMRCDRNTPRGRAGLFAGAAMILGLALGAAEAQAQHEAFVEQSEAGGAAITIEGLNESEIGAATVQRNLTSSRSVAGANVARSPNVARSIVFGDNNQVLQSQVGRNNRSDVGIFAGDDNNVGVLQEGDGLRSTVGLVNTQGVSALVLQDERQPVINVWAIRLASGALLIAR